MQKVTLHALPESEQPWTIEEFVEKNEEICRMAAVDLHRKSTMVEEAVEEVLQLVRKAIDSFQSTADSHQFDFLTGEGSALNRLLLLYMVLRTICDFATPRNRYHKHYLIVK